MFRQLKYLFISLLSILATLGSGKARAEDTTTSRDSTQQEKIMTVADALDVPFETITGDTTALAAYKGQVILIVNVASRCGYTPQYDGLEELYEKYKDQGLVVLGFPANNFGGQEPGTNEEILTFCRTEFGVKFPMMAKISVKGKDKHPLFTYLTEQSPIPGEIKWNFSKFLLNRDGTPVARFESGVKPLSKEMTEAIEKLL